MKNKNLKELEIRAINIIRLSLIFEIKYSTLNKKNIIFINEKS